MTLPKPKVELSKQVIYPIKPISKPFIPSENPIVYSDIQEGTDRKPTGGALRMLKALASRPEGLSKIQLATLSGLSPKSGSYGVYLGLLRSQQYAYDDGDLIKISKKGTEFVGPVESQTSEEIIEAWKQKLTGGARRMFEYLVSIYPNTVTKEELGMQVGMSHVSGSFGVYIGKLRSNQLAENKDGGIKASDNLF